MTQPKTILLAEENAASTQLLVFNLQRAGFEVIIARSSPDLIHLAAQRRVDLILSAVILPDGDGIALCRQLRAAWQSRFLPIVLLSSVTDPDFRVAGMLAGADDFLTKPVGVNELIARLQRLIETYSMRGLVHPLTGLQSGPLIRAYCEHICMEDGAAPWAFLRLDLNHFRAYNQLYGYAAGDRILRMTGDLLREVIAAGTEPPRFIGHSGADDFVLIVRPDEIATLCPWLIAEFDARVLVHYPADQQASRLQPARDRRGGVYWVPRVSLAIGVVTSDLCHQVHFLELEETAHAVLRRAKREETSFYYTNRRAIRRGAALLERLPGLLPPAVPDLLPAARREGDAGRAP